MVLFLFLMDIVIFLLILSVNFIIGLFSDNNFNINLYTLLILFSGIYAGSMIVYYSVTRLCIPVNDILNNKTRYIKIYDIINNYVGNENYHFQNELEEDEIYHETLNTNMGIIVYERDDEQRKENEEIS